MDEKNLYDLAKRFGEKILRQKSSNARIAQMCSVSEAHAARIRQLARDIQSGRLEDEEEGEEDLPKEVVDGLLFDQKYMYNSETDTYLTILRGVPKPIVLSGDTHRALTRAYSNWDGSPSTINQVAREFGFPRPWLIKYLRAHGITHDREPFTQEEVMHRPEDEMVEEGLQMRRMSLYRKLEKEKWKEIQKAAHKWNAFETTTLRALENAMGEREAREVPQLELSPSDEPYALVIGLTDFHHGKYAESGETGGDYNREVGRKRLFRCLNDVMSEAHKRGRPDKIYLPVGSDFLHIDTYGGTTTRGTAQDADGTMYEILDSGCYLMEDVIDYLRQFASVELVAMPGNHDRVTGYAILLYLEALYRKCDDVIVRRDRKPRSYRVYGTNLIGFAHGDGVHKTNELAGLMSNEASEFWHDCKSRTIYTGHLHHERTEADEHFKVVRRQLSSLAGTDRWHKAHGYESIKALPAYIHAYDKGLVGVIYSYGD